MTKPVLLFFLWLALVPTSYADEVMDMEIDYLLDTVVTSNCTFIRNGKEHDPEAAKDHLSMKRNRGKKYYSTADEFIDNLASSSSWSGKPYQIRCGEEQQQPAKQWFDAVLAAYRSSQ